ncbi:MAG: outer membrane beta-barrel protein [Mucilaginibacter sp.]
MRKIAILIALFFNVLFAAAQTGAKIYGQVINSSGIPVVGATVRLINAGDSALATSVVTDNKGYLLIKPARPGVYKLSITHVSYQSYHSGIVTINYSSGSLFLGKIILETAQIRRLKEVAINGRRPFAEHKIDRTVINVDALATNQGINALDVLEKSPGILVDPGGSISLEGKFGVAVYIDDRKSPLSGADLVAYLQSLPSGALDQIELMTNPPAKYDAAGSAGIINIRMKKNKVRGFNGGLTALFGQWRYGKSEERFNFDYRSGKFNLFGNVGNNQQNYASQNSQNREYLLPDGSPASYYALYNFTHGKGYTLSPQAGLDYYASNKTTLGILFGAVIRPLRTTGETDNNFSNQDNQPDSAINQYFNNKHDSKTAHANLNFRHQYDKKGHELSANFDYNFFKISDNQSFKNNSLLTDQQIHSQGEQTGVIPNRIDIYAFKTDYAQPLAKALKIEAGLKTSITHTDNAASYYNTVNNITRPDYTKTNHFIYSENINAAYLNLSKDWKHFSAEAGLRAENTISKGHQLGNPLARDSSFRKVYTSLFPTVYLQYKLDSTGVNQFGFNYGRRINRPFYQDLNPFIIPEDQFNYDAGNPYLQPSYMQNFELSYTFENNLTLKLTHSRTTGDMQVINKLLNGILYSTFENVGFYQFNGISVTGSFSPVKWFSLIAFASLKFEHTQAAFSNILKDIYGNVLFVNGNTQFKLGKGWNAELNGFFQSKTQNIQFNQAGVARLNAVFQKKFSNSLAGRLTCTDFLGLFKYSGSFNSLPSTIATYRNNFDTRGFNISLTWRFGKTIKDLRNHTTNASGDEQGRVKN